MQQIFLSVGLRNNSRIHDRCTKELHVFCGFLNATGAFFSCLCSLKRNSQICRLNSVELTQIHAEIDHDTLRHTSEGEGKPPLGKIPVLKHLKEKGISDIL